MNNRSRIEQEVTVSFNAEEDHAIIYSAYPKYTNKLSKMGFETWKRGGEGTWFKIPKLYVTFRSKKRTSSMTLEQRKACSDRLKLARARQQPQGNI